jgi:hypothetical protein
MFSFTPSKTAEMPRQPLQVIPDYNQMSSSSSSSSAPGTAEQKFHLTHVPAGLVNRSTTKISNIKSRKAKGLKQSEVVSKAYNTVASRPIAMIVNKNQIYHAELRLENLSVLVTSVTVPTFGANAFSLNDFVMRTEYTGLFDQYKIELFEIWIEPLNSQSVTSASVGMVVSAVDFDDATTPSTISSVESKQNSITSGGYDGHYHRFHPHMAVAAYSGAFTSFSNEPAGWIDSASPSVQHYGIKYAATVTGNVMTFALSLRARVAFKQGGI